MMTQNMTQFLFRLSPLCVALLTACASPQWQAPPVDLPQQWQATAANAATAAKSDQAFWLGFADEQLLALQKTASERNADIAVAAIRLRKAGFVVTQRGLDRTPNVSANANGSAAWELDPSRYRGDNYGANVGVSWEIDLWGKLADQQQAARWRERASAADLAAMQQSIMTSVASTYWTIAREQDGLKLAQNELQRAKDTQTIVERRYSAGVVSGLDLTQARSSTLQQENQLSQAQLTLAKSQWQLGLLLDQPPQSTLGAAAVLPSLYPEIPAGVPADILNRRPDLAAATAKLQASFTDQQVVRKNWYPTLSLTGGLGTSSQDLINLLSNPVATLGAGLSLPFIQFNEMELANKTSAADYEQAVIEYRQKLYVSLQEVETALANVAHLKAELPRMQALADETKKAEQQTQLRYQAGSMAFDSVLNARTRRQAADHALLLHRYQLAVASVEVYKVLGGAPLVLR
ncbi:TolC family protein [Deefgea rivuli]|uniref:TolC family protein n=1 Tax=Deefgea rivuli TaxID=400948 RepID=UPI0006854145|nr:TolC family protein [Deefgea rivuli]